METKKLILIISIIVVLLGVVLFLRSSFIIKKEGKTTNLQLISKNMIIESPAFKNNERIPQKYTCDGKDINPPLIISGIPENAKSLALIVDDPDAPMKVWVHWLLWNIPASISEIKENSVPEEAVLGMNDFGRLEWGGPCPPSGTHRYFFKVYALDTNLDLPEGSRKEDLEKAMEGHILDFAQLIGLYSRKN
ncbi:Putative lipoprotein LppC [bacterium HR34]|nr:Putative lipoprotein LppC [bacterium HR34]